MFELTENSSTDDECESSIEDRNVLLYGIALLIGLLLVVVLSFFFADEFDQIVHLRLRELPQFLSLHQNTDIDILCAVLHDLQQTLYRQLHALLLAHRRLIMLLQKLIQHFVFASDGVCRPFGVDSARQSLKHLHSARRSQMRVPSADEHRQSKGPPSAAHSVLLLQLGHESADYHRRGRLLILQTVRLTLHARAVNQHSR